MPERDVSCYDAVAERFAKAREKAGYTQEALAYKAGVSLRTVSRIENGLCKANRSTRKLIAAVLGCKVTDIWGV